MALEVANKTDDSGFWSSADEHPKIKALPGTGACWTGLAPRYSLGVPSRNSSFLSSSCVATQSEKMTGASFDEYVQHTTGQFGGMGELLGGQALLEVAKKSKSHAALMPSSQRWHLLSSKRHRRHSWAWAELPRGSSMTWPQGWFKFHQRCYSI